MTMTTDKKEVEDVSDENFQSIKDHFHRVLMQSQANEALTSLRIEYQTLFFEFEKCFKKKKELQFQSVVQVDSHKDVKKAWNLVEVGRKKDLAIATTVAQLEDQLKIISSQLEDERAICSWQTKEYNGALKDHDALKSEVTELSQSLNQQGKKVKDLEYRNERLEEKNENLRTNNTKLLDDISGFEERLETEKNKYNLLEKDLTEIQRKYDIKVQEHAEVLHSEIAAKKKVDSLNRSLSNAQRKLNSQESALSEMRIGTRDLKDNLQMKKDQLSNITTELHAVQNNLEVANSSRRVLEVEKAQLQRQYDHEHKTVLRLQQSFKDIKAINISLQKEIQTLHRDLDKVKESENELQRHKRFLERDKNMQGDKIQRIEKLMKQAEEDAWHQEQTVLSLNNDLSSAQSEIDTIQKKVLSLEQLYEKQNNDIVEWQKKLDQSNNEIQSREMQIRQMKKEVIQLNGKLKDQELIYNKCRAEQGKALRELLDEKSENENTKNRNSVLSLEVETLRNELLSKEESLVKTHFDKREEVTKKVQLSNELLALKRQILERDDIIKKQDLKMQKLNTTIKHMDEDSSHRQKEYDQLLNERDILNSHIIRRNDELALLYEKVKIQMITLNKGEMQYRERVEDLRHLTIKLQDTKRKLNCVNNCALDQTNMNRVLIQKDKELLNQQIKVKALSEELQNPLNMHRWRKLEGSDPSKFELVQKNEVLQKRLISKTEEVIEKEAVIVELHEQIEGLNKKLVRKPGVEIIDKLKIKENELREKARQMKAMAGELNMNQAQVIEFKKVINRLNVELLEVKHKYFEQKKKEASIKDKELQWYTENGFISCIETAYHSGEQSMIDQSRKGLLSSSPPPHQKVRFVGGGFAVK